MKTIKQMLVSITIIISILLTSISIPKTDTFTSYGIISRNTITLSNSILEERYSFSNTIPLTNNYVAVLPTNTESDNITEEISIPEEPVETHEEIINRLVHDVDTGKAGNGKDRVKYLGEYYCEVQKIINKKYSYKKPTTKSSSTSYKISQPKSELQSYAHDLLISKGFTEEDFTCLVKLWNRESGWNPNAHNKSSGAHGIPQALPASKMASYGSDYYTNGYTQINWGIDYIINRYGSPKNAWSHFQKKNWY